jgi:hypothetical protein
MQAPLLTSPPTAPPPPPPSEEDSEWFLKSLAEWRGMLNTPTVLADIYSVRITGKYKTYLQIAFSCGSDAQFVFETEERAENASLELLKVVADNGGLSKKVPPNYPFPYRVICQLPP